MKKHAIWKPILSTLLTIALTLGGLYVLSEVTERKDSREKYQGFFEEKQNIDVLFMGTSLVMNGIAPMDLWEDYGITSYNFGNHASMLPTTYWTLKNALDYVSPKTVVIDCKNLAAERKNDENFSYMHQAMDAFPLSVNKIRAVRDLLDDPARDQKVAEGKLPAKPAGEDRTAIGILWDFSVYHSRWKELTREDFKPKNSIEMGAEMRVAVVEPYEFETIDRTDKQLEDTRAIEYLNRMIDELQEQGIQVLLINMPRPASPGTQRQANRVYDIAEEQGVEYINFFTMDLVNFRTDMYDEDTHLNPSGARKTTKYLGQVLRDRYGAEDHRGQAGYESWDARLEAYENEKRTWLGVEDPKCFLMLLYDDDYDVYVEAPKGAVLRDEKYAELWRNLGLEPDTFTEETDFAAIWGGDQTAVTAENFLAGGQAVAAPGERELALYRGDSGYGVYVNGDEIYTVEGTEQTGTVIRVVRHATGEILYTREF